MADSDIILGIDPGSRNTGVAILTRQEGRLVALRCDVLNMSDMDDHAERLQYIYTSISKLVRSFEPTHCAIETPVYGVDPLAMLKLGRAQAAAMLAVTSGGIPVQEYYPKEVKKSITGNGNASKKQVAFMLHKMVKLTDEKLSQDATDALAVAWCHLMKSSGIPKASKSGHQNHGKGGWESFIADNPDRVKKF